MTAIATPTYDAILDGIVTGLAPLTVPLGGASAPGRYFNVTKRYMGESFDQVDAGERGVAGRTPAALVAFAGEQPYRTTIGRRRDRVQATFLVICVSDSKRSKDDRKVVLQMIYDARKQVGDTQLGLPISPLRYTGVAVVAENDVLTAYAARFMTRYSVDYTVNPGTDTIQSADGQIVYPQATPAASAAPTIGIQGVPAADRYAYDVQALFAGAPSSDWSAWTEIRTAPSPLGGASRLVVSWLAAPGATSYRLRRRWAPVGVSTGVIYTGAGLTFTDDGTVVADGNVLPERGLNYDGDF